MRITGKVRQTVERVTTAAADTRQAIVILGVVAVAALVLAVAAIFLGRRRGRAMLAEAAA